MLYIYDNNTIIKILNIENKLLESLNLENELKELTKIKIEGVFLPIELVYRNNKFVGYTMTYFNGPTLTILLNKINKGKINITENDLYSLYYSLVCKIKKLSEAGIKVNDIKPDNIIYYKNELCLVDCDFYSYNKDINDLYEYNMKLLDKCLEGQNIFKEIIYSDTNDCKKVI